MRSAALLIAMLGCSVATSLAQSAAPRPLRFGVLFWHESPNDTASFEGIEAALRESGRAHEFIVHHAREERDAALRHVDDFRAQDVDLIFALGTQATMIAAEKIRDLPIVFTAVTNPVESGIVETWRGSARNIAGNSNWIAPETLLHVFHQTVPNLRRLGVLRSPEAVVSAAELRSVQAHLANEPSGTTRPTQGRGVELVSKVVATPEELAQAIAGFAADRVDAIWVPIDFMVYQHMPEVFAAARTHRLPIVSSSLRGTRDGAVAGVVVDYRILGARAVVLALDILERGVDPGTLPIETMQGYRVVVNLEAARQTGHPLPLSLLVTADVLLERLDTQLGASTTEAERAR